MMALDRIFFLFLKRPGLKPPAWIFLKLWRWAMDDGLRILQSFNHPTAIHLIEKQDCTGILSVPDTNVPVTWCVPSD